MENRFLKSPCQLPFQAVLSEIQRVTTFSALPQGITGMERRDLTDESNYWRVLKYDKKDSKGLRMY